MEDNLKAWMTCFLKLVEYENPILAEQDSEQESCLDGVKAAVCESITLFVQLNEEDFEEFLQPFVMAIWAQLVKVSPNPGQVCQTFTDESNRYKILQHTALLQTCHAYISHFGAKGMKIYVKMFLVESNKCAKIVSNKLNNEVVISVPFSGPYDNHSHPVPHWRCKDCSQHLIRTRKYPATDM